MLKTHAVGIDLGTTYSCLSYLNEHGEPVTAPNHEGELCTPSIVMFDGGEVIVGTEALRNSVLKPLHVVQNAKRYIGSNKVWTIDGVPYTPIDIGAFVLKKMISAAEEQIGEIKQAVITVPAQFSDWQRQATVEAGMKAGLKTVDIINEPVAAALCYVLGSEGLWFTELADEQRILVYDLGGGTFDLSLVKYHKDEVKVLASTGDLHLGGIDWNETLQEAICTRFAREFGSDPRQDAESMQLLAMSVENTKRGLTVRPRAALTCTHGGHRKVYQIEQADFEKLTKPLLDRTIAITRDLQKAYGFGLKPSDIILTTGGSSRMPMIKKALAETGFRNPNTSLSPDQSISHGATYYAGMLLTNTEFAKSILSAKATAKLSKIKQHSVNARALGILVRDADKKSRVPHYLIPANTELPASIEQTFGTVTPNQKRVHLHIVESGTVADQGYVELGTCIVDNLPPNLPENSLVQVTISYNEQARVLVTARDLTSGKQAQTVIARQENLLTKPAAEIVESADDDVEVAWTSLSLKSEKPASNTSATADAPRTAAPASKPKTAQASGVAAPSSTKPAVKAPTNQPSAAKPKPVAATTKATATGEPRAPVGGTPAATKTPTSAPKASSAVPRSDNRAAAAGAKSVLNSPRLEDASQPVPLCNDCGEPLDFKGRCRACGWSVSSNKKPAASVTGNKPAASTAAKPGGARPANMAAPPRKLAAPAEPAIKRAADLDDDELLDMALSDTARPRPGKPVPKPAASAAGNKPTKKPNQSGEDKFWEDES